MLSASRLMGAARRGLAPGALATQTKLGLARVQLPTALSVPAVAARTSFQGAAQTRFFILASPAWRNSPASRSATAWARLRASSSKAGTESATRREQVMAKSKPHWERLKDLWRKYGVVAIGTYLSLYGVVLGSIYVGISQGWVRTKKRTTSNGEGSDDDFNLVTTTNKFVTLAENLGVAKYLEVEHVSSKTGTFLLAWVATKFTEPLRLALTLAITPRIARFVGRAPQLPSKALKATQTKAKTQKPKPQQAQHDA